MDSLSEILENVTELPPIVIGVVVAVAVLAILGLRLILRKPPSHLTAFTGESGSVLVSRKALQELVKRTCMRDEWVEAARPNVTIANSKVHTKVELRLASPDNLKDTTERLQSNINSLLEKSLSFDQIGDIQLFVTSFGSTLSDAESESVSKLQVSLQAASPEEPASVIGPADKEADPKEEPRDSESEERDSAGKSARE